MKMRKALSVFLALVCTLCTFGLFALGTSAEGERVVYATTRASSVQQGSYTYLDVYLDDLSDLSALNISVYYDPAQVTVKNAYNSVSASVYDIHTESGCVNASYVFDGKGGAAKTKLFYFYFQVNSTAEVGDVFFDIVVTEAYDNSLGDLPLRGSRCSFSVTEKPVNKSCSISSTSSVSTSVGEEFELSYRLGTYQVASGSMVIQYDPELFEVVSVTNGSFLTGKIYDVNTALDGAVQLSFIGTSYQYGYDLIRVRFKTLKNVSESSDIKLTVSELHDLDLNPYTCNGYTSKVNVVFDETYTEDAPSMRVSASYSKDTGKVIASVLLEKNSMLGAGDFELRFDPDVLSAEEVKKGFSPTFFIINDTEISEGLLKFSLISTEDITGEETVLTVTFDARGGCEPTETAIQICGDVLTDSLTNAIVLNFIDASVEIPVGHTEADAVEENRIAPTCTAEGSYELVVYCSVCGEELSRETKTVEKAAHSYKPTGECSECGAYRAVFSGASLTLEDTIAVNFKVSPEQFVGTALTDPYVVFVFLGEELVQTEYTVDAKGNYAFTFSDIAPRMMNDVITATLYVVEDGRAVPCQTRSYSVREYCYNMLARCEAGEAYADRESFKTLLVDLLNYGAAAQIYGDYQNECLVTDALTDAQKAWATESDPVLETVLNTKYQTVENPCAEWKAGGLLLEDAVTMRFKFSTDSTEGLYAHFATEDNPEGWTVDASSFVPTSGGYYVYFNGLRARQMRQTVYVTLYRDGVAVSHTVSYSIASYAYAKQNDADQTLTALLIAMMKYGDSAARYIDG